MQQMIRKNHMDIAWHEYTDENGEDISGHAGKPDGEGIDHRACRNHASVLRHGSVACQKFYEYTCRDYGNYLYGRYRSDVD